MLFIHKLFRILPSGLWLLTLLSQLNAYKKLPEFVKPCRNDENLSSCSRQVLETLRPYLEKGIPELDLPSINPLYIPKITAVRKNSPLASYNATLTNLNWTGVKDFEILKLSIDIDIIVIRLKLGFPNLFCDNDVTATGTIAGIDVDGSGTTSFGYDKVTLDIVLNGEEYQYDGEQFIKWKEEDVDVDYGNAYFTRMSGLFGNPALDQLLRITINNAAHLLRVMFNSAIELSIGNFVVEIINNIHRIFPKNTLYLS